MVPFYSAYNSDHFSALIFFATLFLQTATADTVLNINTWRNGCSKKGKNGIQQ